MRPFERRAAKAYPYYKLAVWNPIRLTWDDGKRAYESEAAARATARKPGRYRISEVTERERFDLEPFEVK